MTQNISVLNFSVPASLSPCCLSGEGCIALRIEATESLAPIHTVLTHHGEKTGIFQGEIKLQTSQGKQREKLYGKEHHHLCNAHAKECSPQKISDSYQAIENYLCNACSHRDCFWCWVQGGVNMVSSQEHTCTLSGRHNNWILWGFLSFKSIQQTERAPCLSPALVLLNEDIFHLWHDTLHAKLSLLQSSWGAKSISGSQWAVP